MNALFPTHDYDDTFFECEGADVSDLEREAARRDAERLDDATRLVPVSLEALNDVFIDDEMPVYSAGRYWAVVKLFPVVIIPSRETESVIARCAS